MDPDKLKALKKHCLDPKNVGPESAGLTTRPWWLDGWVGVTDGKALILLPDPERSVPELSALHATTVSTVIPPVHAPKRTMRTSVTELRIWCGRPGGYKCEFCHDAGDMKCGYCDKGRVRAQCPACDGHVHDCVCQRCEGSGRRDCSCELAFVEGLISGMTVNRNLLAKALDLDLVGGVCHVEAVDKTWLRIWGTGWRIVLCGMHSTPTPDQKKLRFKPKAVKA